MILPRVSFSPSVSTGKQDLAKSNFFDGLGNQFTGNLDYSRQLELLEKEMAFNSQEAQKQRDYAYMMDTTQYQRAVEDMKKAGLNPYLAYSNGGNNSSVVSSARVGGSNAPRSGKGFSLLSGLAMSLVSSASSLGSTLIQANNAMQLADMKDSTLRYLTKYLR